MLLSPTLVKLHICWTTIYIIIQLCIYGIVQEYVDMSVNSAVFLHLLTQSPDLPQDNSKWPPAEQTERFSFTCSVCMPLTHPHTTHPWHTHTHPTEIDPSTTTYTRIHTYIYMYNYIVHTYRHPLRMWEDTTQCKYIQKLIIHNYRWGTQI